MKMLIADYRSPDVARPVQVEADGTGFATLADTIERDGFAVCAMPSELGAQEALELLSKQLDLGEPYIPQLYRLPETRDSYAHPYVRIERNDSDAHPGFATAAGQAMHTDGLLDPIGTISVTALYCVRPAARGGATVIFNAVAAYAELRAADPEAAEVLAHPEVLTRRATLPGVDRTLTGPAFAETEDGLITRFCYGGPDEWRGPEGEEAALERALKFLNDASAVDGRYRISVVLESGQCLVSRNDRVSHGRESYEDTATSPRSMLRALYTRAPR
jgi:hypothetical protein